jgi:hypothetical protein
LFLSVSNVTLNLSRQRTDFFIDEIYSVFLLKKFAVFHEIFQAESVRDAAWGCDWVGTPVPFQRCLAFIIATANKEFTLTAGKFVPVSNSTMMNVRTHILLHSDLRFKI